MARHKSSRRRLWLVCAVLAPLALFMPIPASINGLMQVLVPVQHALRLPDDAPLELRRLDSEALADQLLRAEALEHTVAALAAANEELRRERTDLTRIRDTGYNGRLIVADVVAGDSLGWRASSVLDRGTLTGVHVGETVMSRHFDIRTAQNDKIEDGMSVLAAEVLVGEIVEVNTYTARVRLITDQAAPERLVRISGLDVTDPQGPAVVRGIPEDFVLSRLDPTTLIVRGVPRAYVEDGHIQRGDAVATSLSDLPWSVHIGTICDTRAVDGNPTLIDLLVEPALNLERLRKVYVLDTRSEPAP